VQACVVAPHEHERLEYAGATPDSTSLGIRFISTQDLAMAESNLDKLARFQLALSQFLERIAVDRNILAVVLVGSLNEETIWRHNSIGLWIVETDGVSRRLRSDGNEERVYRILVENGINIHAEIIARSRFKMMVEGASRTSFSCNFFATRTIVHCKDSSIDAWFEQANSVAVKDQERELLAFTTWTIYAIQQARRLLEIKQDNELAYQELIHAAHSVAYTEIIRAGNLCEAIPIYQAIELQPSLFKTIYLDLLANGRDPIAMSAALSAVDAYLHEHQDHHLKPLLTYLHRENRTVPLSEMSDHFAFSQIYPWHLEAACEWLERNGLIDKLSTPFKLTKRSQEHVEEPAYYLDKSSVSGR
jgi:uncharacterized protein